VSQRASGTFAGLIDGTFGLLRQTWRTTLACGAIAFLPAAALYGWAYRRLFDAYVNVVPAVEHASLSSVLSLVGVFSWILLAALVQGVAVLFVRACVTARAAGAVRGRSVPAPMAAVRTFRQDGARLVGQRVLQGLVYAGVFAATVVLIAVVLAIVGGFTGISGTSLGVFALIFLCYLAGIVAWVWLWARFSLTLESVVIDGAKARQSFGLSASLVRRSWWRVFGYRLLFGMMLGFAASLIATPIVFFATIRAYARYLSEMVQGTADAGSLVDMFRTMGSGLPVRLAVFLYLQSLLNAFFAPVFMTLLYFEMKRRRAEASRSMAESSAPVGPAASVVPETPGTALSGTSDTAPEIPTDRQGES
jgi:hypothetical protein